MNNLTVVVVGQDPLDDSEFLLSRPATSHRPVRLDKVLGDHGNRTLAVVEAHEGTIPLTASIESWPQSGHMGTSGSVVKEEKQH